jgi:hypothetical protein
MSAQRFDGSYVCWQNDCDAFSYQSLPCNSLSMSVPLQKEVFTVYTYHRAFVLFLYFDNALSVIPRTTKTEDGTKGP